MLLTVFILTILGEWKMTAEGRKNTTLPKQKFSSLLKKLWTSIQPTARTNLQSAFRKCGIVPLDVQPLLDRLPQTVDYNLVSESFKELVMNFRKSSDGQTTRKRKRATNAHTPAGWFNVSIFYCPVYLVGTRNS